MFEGKVKKLLYNHHDDVDGWLLSDETLVHFPPHIGETLGEWISEGAQVFLEGESHANRNGENVIFPTYVESQGWCLEFEQKKPGRRKDGWGNPPESQGGEKVSNEDIMRELLHIRSMLEGWGL